MEFLEQLLWYFPSLFGTFYNMKLPLKKVITKIPMTHLKWQDLVSYALLPKVRKETPKRPTNRKIINSIVWEVDRRMRNKVVQGGKLLLQ